MQHRFSDICLVCLAVCATGHGGEAWRGASPAASAAVADIAIDLPVGRTTLRIHHPAEGAGPWPVIIFSHGLAGSREGYGFLGRRWAEHGYVSVHPDHPGSDTATFRGLPPRDLPAALRSATTDPAVLEGRPRLVAALIDGLPAIEAAVPALVGRLDRARVGVAGHSFGAWTTMCVAGMRLRGPGGAVADWSDPRPLAFAALSPNGKGQWAQDDDWAAIARPVLVMTGSADRQPAFLSPPGQERSGAWRRQAFDLMPAGSKLLAWFDGALHSTYSGGAGARLMGEAQPDPAQVEAVAVLTLAWWDARLRGDPAATAWLADPGSAAALGPWATLIGH
jgi:dienelactone hydrolase